jgi:hypothetical protein
MAKNQRRAIIWPFQELNTRASGKQSINENNHTLKNILRMLVVFVGFLMNAQINLWFCDCFV